MSNNICWTGPFEVCQERNSRSKKVKTIKDVRLGNKMTPGNTCSSIFNFDAIDADTGKEVSGHVFEAKKELKFFVLEEHEKL